MNIGEAARLSGLSAKMIRHYEQLNLLTPVARSAAGYREYNAQHIEALKFIRQARVLGFSMAQIDALLSLWQDPARSSRAVKEVALAHLQEVEHKLQELAAMQTTLKNMINACSGDDNSHCPILEQLAQKNKPQASKTQD